MGIQRGFKIALRLRFGKIIALCDISINFPHHFQITFRLNAFADDLGIQCLGHFHDTSHDLKLANSVLVIKKEGAVEFDCRSGDMNETAKGMVWEEIASLLEDWRTKH